MNLTLPSVLLFSLASTIFGAGGFYLLTNWRIKALETHQAENKDIRERLVRIETMLTELKEKAQ